MKFKNAGLLVIAVAMAAFGAVQGSGGLSSRMRKRSKHGTSRLILFDAWATSTT